MLLVLTLCFNVTLSALRLGFDAENDNKPAVVALLLVIGANIACIAALVVKS